MIERPSDWVAATSNPGKLGELRALLAGSGIRLVPQSDLGVASPEENAPTFIENALLKARHAARATGLPAIADDSGLVVAALGGAPGVRSARFAGRDASDAANVRRLLALLAATPEGRREARFHCVIVALGAPEDPAPAIGCGTWLGRVAMAPAGDGGFGYDPVFFDPDLGMTAAEMSPELKNSRSHRARALEALRTALARR